MKLYHGSKQRLDRIESRHANKGDVEVPEDELLNGIYLTPNYGFAVAMAIRPENSSISIDEKKAQITFEKPELFQPAEDIFIYTFDSTHIPAENLKYVDEFQLVVLGMDALIPEEVSEAKASKVLDYYELTNWKQNNEPTQESRNEFKLK